MPVLDPFTESYIEAMLWVSADDDDFIDGEYGIDDIAPETLETIIAECAAFQTANAADIEAGPANSRRAGGAVSAGHDFYLTRCGHGAGFWDGDWPEPAASRLTAASEKAGEVTPYVQGGKVYCG